MVSMLIFFSLLQSDWLGSEHCTQLSTCLHPNTQSPDEMSEGCVSGEAVLSHSPVLYSVTTQSCVVLCYHTVLCCTLLPHSPVLFSTTHRSIMASLYFSFQSGKPLIFLPSHRSHLDYILITFILWHFGIRAPYVAAGDNLNIFGFG